MKPIIFTRGLLSRLPAALPLTPSNAKTVLTLPGNGNGLAVDSAGDIFFAVNDAVTGFSTLGMLDAHSGSDYDTIYSGNNYYYSELRPK